MVKTMVKPALLLSLLSTIIGLVSSTASEFIHRDCKFLLPHASPPSCVKSLKQTGHHLTLQFGDGVPVTHSVPQVVNLDCGDKEIAAYLVHDGMTRCIDTYNGTVELMVSVEDSIVKADVKCVKGLHGVEFIVRQDGGAPAYDVSQFGRPEDEKEGTYTAIIPSNILGGAKERDESYGLMLRTGDEVSIHVKGVNKFLKKKLKFQPFRVVWKKSATAIIYHNGAIDVVKIPDVAMPNISFDNLKRHLLVMQLLKDEDYMKIINRGQEILSLSKEEHANYQNPYTKIAVRRSEIVMSTKPAFGIHKGCKFSLPSLKTGPFETGETGITSKGAPQVVELDCGDKKSGRVAVHEGMTRCLHTYNGTVEFMVFVEDSVAKARVGCLWSRTGEVTVIIRQPESTPFSFTESGLEYNNGERQFTEISEYGGSFEAKVLTRGLYIIRVKGVLEVIETTTLRFELPQKNDSKQNSRRSSSFKKDKSSRKTRPSVKFAS